MFSKNTDQIKLIKNKINLNKIKQKINIQNIQNIQTQLINRKKYIFILCPPYQGSTPIINLLESSNNTTTFVSAPTQFGEGQWLLSQNSMIDYDINKWDPSYKINMDLVKTIYDKYWDHTKLIYVEKSPPLICRAEQLEEYFSQFGDVYFIISIRSPYSTDHYSSEEWIKFAEYQKQNIDTLKNKIIITYEELCTDTDNVINKIKNVIPELYDIHNQSNPNIKTERGKKINSNKVNRIIDKNYDCLKNHVDLLNFFGYKLI